MRFAIHLYQALSDTPSPLLVIFLLSTVSLVTWQFFTWKRFTHNRLYEARLVGITVLSFGLLDWVMLLALPKLGLSFGPVASSLAVITLVRLGVLLLMLFVMLVWKTINRRYSIIQPVARRNLFLVPVWMLNLCILAGSFYGMYLEPFNLGSTPIKVKSQAFFPDRLLRIVQLSDLHVERITKREQEMLATLQVLQPDLIVLTGDYLNIDYVDDPLTQQHAAQVLGQLAAPYGVYAVLAPGVDRPQAMRRVFGDLENITLLQDEVQRIDFPGQSLYLLGISTRNISQDSAILSSLMAQLPETAFSLLLYHKPDLAYAAQQEKVDLYLAGHTHGGQIRLPFYGALITFSAFGKRFEMGRYQLDETTLYVSRGIGLEGLNLPRVRFLCPPEIVYLELGMEVQP